MDLTIAHKEFRLTTSISSTLIAYHWYVSSALRHGTVFDKMLVIYDMYLAINKVFEQYYILHKIINFAGV